MCVCVCMHACVCVCMHACMHVCVCVHACVCVCVAKPVAVELRCHVSTLIFSFMHSFVFKQQVLLRVDFLSVTFDHRVQCPRVWLRVKIKDILKHHFFFPFIFLSYNQSYLKNRYYSGFVFFCFFIFCGIIRS